jgi:hypothetical protein
VSVSYEWDIYILFRRISVFEGLSGEQCMVRVITYSLNKLFYCKSVSVNFCCFSHISLNWIRSHGILPVGVDM